MTNDQQHSPKAHRRARQISNLSDPEPRQSILPVAPLRIAAIGAGVALVMMLGLWWQGALGGGTTELKSGGAAAPAAVAPSQDATATGADATATGADATASTQAANAQAPATAGPRNLPQIWQERLAALDERRLQAFETQDQSLLAHVNVAGSPALAHDKKLLATLVSRGAKPVAHQTSIHSATPISSDSESALIEVVDSRSEYVLTTESMNRTIQRFEAAEKQRWRVSLRNIDGSWQIYQVVAAT